MQAKMSRMNALFDERMNRMAKQIEMKADRDALKKLEERFNLEHRRLTQVIEQLSSDKGHAEERFLTIDDHFKHLQEFVEHLSPGAGHSLH